MASTAQAKVKVVTTTPDLAAIAREVGGKHAEVVSLARGDQDLHFVEPRPSMVQHLRKADVFVKVGMDLDIWAQGLVDAARNPKIVYGAPGYVDASAGLKRLELPTVKLDPSMGHIHLYGNPHYWLDPRNGKIIARNVLGALQKVSPAEADFFAHNYDDFCARLDKAVARWQGQVKPYRGEQIVVYHKSWVYFEDCFGMREFGEVEPKPGIPPSPAHVNALIKQMKAARIKLILMEPFYPQKFPQMIARETDAKLLVVPTSVGGRKEIKNYFELFDYLVNTITTALK
jgi:ABC-type Zn uptake system ZnuABC Zn-binding protein ZnuA